MNKLTILLSAIFLFSISSQVRADDAPASSHSTTDAAPNGPVEKRITELHAKLKITADQESLWAPIAQEMRDEGKAFRDSIKNRENKSEKMTAVEDLTNYQEMAALHAESLKKFIAVFTPLYSVMSNDQKANADAVFREHKHGKRKGGKS